MLLYYTYAITFIYCLNTFRNAHRVSFANMFVWIKIRFLKFIFMNSDEFIFM